MFLLSARQGAGCWVEIKQNKAEILTLWSFLSDVVLDTLYYNHWLPSESLPPDCRLLEVWIMSQSTLIPQSQKHQALNKHMSITEQLDEEINASKTC